MPNVMRRQRRRLLKVSKYSTSVERSVEVFDKACSIPFRAKLLNQSCGERFWVLKYRPINATFVQGRKPVVVIAWEEEAGALLPLLRWHVVVES
jgi:hypothetical protein